MISKIKREKLFSKYKTNYDKLDTEKLKEFKEKLKSLTDPRIKKKTTYKIWDIVIVVFLATLSNCNEWEEIELFAKSKYEWLRTFLLMTGGIPVAKTYENIIALINPKELEDMCTLFIKDFSTLFTNKKDILAIDGKTDNGSSRKENEIREKIKSLNVLNVYSNEHRMCLASEIIDSKTNEITAIPSILKRLNLKNAIVTWDALNTQTSNIEAVIDNHGDYVVALKGNHGNFYKDVVDYFDEDRLNIIKSGYEGSFLIEREKSHGKVITYEYYQTEKVKWYDGYEDWKKLRSIGIVVKTTEENGKKTIEKRYYISSLLLDIMLFSNAIRKHWSVENKLHWHLDFTFKQDKNTTANKQALFNLQIIKKLSLAVLERVKEIYGYSLKKIRLMLSLNFEMEILRIFNILANSAK